MKDGPLPEHMEVGSTEAGINAKESTAKTSAGIDAQRPAEGPNAVAVATTADTPALASAAAGSALTASQTARLEPVRKVLVKPDGMPIATISSNSAGSTSPSETPKPHTEAATTAGVRVDSARPPAAKIELVGEAHCQQNASKKNCCKECEGHNGSNGRDSETAASAGAARKSGEVTHRSSSHRSSCCRAKYADHADHVRRAVRQSIDASVCLSDPLAGSPYPTPYRSKHRSKVKSPRQSFKGGSRTHDRSKFGIKG